MKPLAQIDHLHTEDDFCKKLIDSLPFPVIIAKEVNGTAEHQYLNKQFVTDIGYTIEEIPTINEWFIHAYPDAQHRYEVEVEWAKLMDRAISSHEAFVMMESLITTKKNEKIWFKVKVSIKDNMFYVGFVNIQEIKQICMNKDKMLSILSHDIRGPIGNLYTLSKMTLEHDFEQAEFLELLKSLNESSLRVLDLVETTVQWARLNFDKINIKNENVPILKIVNDVLKIYKENYINKKIAVQVLIDEKLEIETDWLILHVILRNIISNAIKFTNENGEIVIKSEGNSIFVSDNGIGMDEKTIAKLLTDSNTSTQGTKSEKGVGIGFKLVRDLIGKINAKISITSKPNVGTTAVIEF